MHSRLIYDVLKLTSNQNFNSIHTSKTHSNVISCHPFIILKYPHQREDCCLDPHRESNCYYLGLLVRVTLMTPNGCTGMRRFDNVCFLQTLCTRQKWFIFFIPITQGKGYLIFINWARLTCIFVHTKSRLLMLI